MSVYRGYTATAALNIINDTIIITFFNTEYISCSIARLQTMFRAWQK